MFIDSIGTGPALVMIHGWAMHSAVFAPLTERLQQHFTVYLVDLPGHGRSRDSVLPLQLDSVITGIIEKTPPALWLGWSLGGLFALRAAQYYPATVRGLIMLCASPRFVDAADWPLGMDAHVFAGFVEQLEQDYRGTLDRFLKLEVQGSDHVRDDLRVLRAAIYATGEPSKQTLCKGLRLLHDSDLRCDLATLATPSLWLAGQYDRLVCAEAMQAAASRCRASRFVQIANASHAPFLSHAKSVSDAIVDFSATISA